VIKLKVPSVNLEMKSSLHYVIAIKPISHQGDPLLLMKSLKTQILRQIAYCFDKTQTTVSETSNENFSALCDS